MSEIDKHRRSKRSSKNGTRAEQAAAARHGGKTNAGSGAFHPGSGGGSHRNDFRTDHNSFEWKYTDHASFSVKDIQLTHAWTDALTEGRVGIFGIEFSSGNRWVIMKEDDFLEMQQELDDLYQEATEN